MRPLSITILQDPKKAEFVTYFYSQILRLPGETKLTDNYQRWFSTPVFLATRVADRQDSQETWGGFTGVQLNVVPSQDLNPIVAILRATGIPQAEPREVGDVRLLNVFDPSGNSLMLVGSDQTPDEPTIEEAVGSISIFVSDIKRARNFYVDALGLPLRAEPHEGLVVIGAKVGTALLVYQVPPNLPHAPIGRRTGLTFADPDPGNILAAVTPAGGVVVHREDPGGDGFVLAGTFKDPDGNELMVISQRHLSARDNPEASDLDFE